MSMRTVGPKWLDIPTVGIPYVAAPSAGSVSNQLSKPARAIRASLFAIDRAA